MGLKTLRLRVLYAETDEITESVRPEVVGDPAFCPLMARLPGDPWSLVIARCILDPLGMFNTELLLLPPKDGKCRILQGKQKAAHHKQINQFIARTADVRLMGGVIPVKIARQ